MVEVLQITAVGMGLVFAAMGLVLGTMLLLTRIRDPHEAADDVQAASGADEKRRVAVVAAAVARARASATRRGEVTPPLPPPEGETTSPLRPGPWLAYYRNRQLNSRSRHK